MQLFLNNTHAVAGHITSILVRSNKQLEQARCISSWQQHVCSSWGQPEITLPDAGTASPLRSLFFFFLPSSSMLTDWSESREGSGLWTRSQIKCIYSCISWRSWITCSAWWYSPCCSQPMSNTYIPGPHGWKTGMEWSHETLSSDAHDVINYHNPKTTINKGLLPSWTFIASHIVCKISNLIILMTPLIWPWVYLDKIISDSKQHAIIF